ncbi:MAG: PIG-L family deacetylase [Flavobacterium sp.]|nr:MAG: PIG-L family deacetylase [Flavobacterium sp.]
MNFRVYLVALLTSAPFFSNAQMQQLNAAEIASGIAKLNVKASVLYIAAHPDDENTRLLAYLAKEANVRAGYLSLTRGDGGQNLIGNEQAELLGLIRTQELLAARNVDGAEQFFTRANDFGFSKTPEESFKIWGKEQILADVVWVIRKFKPDVIITRFPEDSRAGHGHHSGSAILAREAFIAAADAKRFPEQLKHVQPWQAKRILWNTFNFGSTNTTAPDQLKIDVGLFNPLLGKSYGEIAAISRTNHKSQGFGSALQRGEAYEYFSHVAGEKASSTLLDGVNTTWENPKIKSLLAKIKTEFSVNAPSKSIPALIELKKLVKNQNFNHKLLDDLILACAGIWIEANTTSNTYAKGDEIPVQLQAISRVEDVKIIIDGKQTALNANGLQSFNQQIATKDLKTTQPYWLTQNHPIGQFSIENPLDVGYPENPNSVSVKFQLLINGETFDLSTPLVSKSTDPIKGERYQPLVIAPKVTATLSEKAYVFSTNAPKAITVSLNSFTDNAKGILTPKLPAGWKSNPEKIDFNLAKKGDEQTVVFAITPGNQASGTLNLEVNIAGETESKGLKTISYDHIPNITIFPSATARLEKIDLKIVGNKVAYIDGAGDLVPDALREMGYGVTHLTPAQILTADLSNYNAIVVGVRFYNISNEAKLIQPKLLKYVENGGTLLIQYNVNNGLKTTDIGPYPFKLINKRVTEEDAKVRFIDPKNPALNYPNKITDKDFDGWVQERGLYFATDIDPKYQTIFSMNDTGDSPSDGSLLIANHGKGKFVYTSLVFFRELPAGVPGAYRLFANLLAPKQP